MYDERPSRGARGRAERIAERGASTCSAVEMLDAFASVGAKAFDLTITSENGEKVSFRRGVRGQELCRALPDLLVRCRTQRWNLIVRPRPLPVFLQLDDLDVAARDRVQAVSFLSLETSPGNYQAWMALLNSAYMAPIRRIKKNIGADPSASGATRVAGSINFKAKYSPSFPQVAICHVNPGLLVDVAALAELGLLCEVDSEPVSRVRGPLIHRFAKKWPSYERCLAGAPLNNDGAAPDVSRADFTFCLIAIDWGWTPDETAARLMEESAKAKENGQAYALLTANRAAEAAARRPGKNTREL